MLEEDTEGGVRLSMWKADVRVNDNRPLGGLGPRLAWNGSRLALAWFDSRFGSHQIYARRLARDGTPAGASVAATSTAVISRAIFVDLEWNRASGLGMAWTNSRDVGLGTYFRRLDLIGAPLSPETRIADPVAGDVEQVQIALSHLATCWAVAIEDFRASECNEEIRLSFADLAGAKLGPEIALPMNANNNGSSDVHWTGGHFLMAIERTGAPDNQEPQVATYLPDGTLVSNPNRISNASGRSIQPSLSGGGAARAGVWRDTRDGNCEIYAAALDRFGVRVGPGRRRDWRGALALQINNVLVMANNDRS